MDRLIASTRGVVLASTLAFGAARQPRRRRALASIHVAQSPAPEVSRNDGDNTLPRRPQTPGSNAFATRPVIAAIKGSESARLPAEWTPGPSQNERTGTRRPGCRDVVPEPSVGTFTVESKRARSTGPTRRWTVPECARMPAWGIAPMCRSRTLTIASSGVHGPRCAGARTTDPAVMQTPVAEAVT